MTLDAETYFPKDSARLRVERPESAAARSPTDLRRRGPGRVRIVGYTDDLGSERGGWSCRGSGRPAVAGVLRPLLPGGAVPLHRVGRGEADPAVPNTSEANRKLNRRVELTYNPSR